MNRMLGRWTGLAGLWLAGATLGLAAESRVVFVHMDRVFNEFYKTKLADTQLKEQGGQVQAERKKLTDEYEALQPALIKLREDAQNPALSEDVRAQKRNAYEEKMVEIRDFENKIKRFDETRQKQLDDQRRRMRKRIVDEILETIQVYGRNQMFTAVLDSSGQSLNGVPTVVFVEPRVDITGDVITMLNRGQPSPVKEKEAAAPAEKAEDKKAPEPKPK